MKGLAVILPGLKIWGHFLAPSTLALRKKIQYINLAKSSYSVATHYYLHMVQCSFICNNSSLAKYSISKFTNKKKEDTYTRDNPIWNPNIDDILENPHLVKSEVVCYRKIGKWEQNLDLIFKNLWYIVCYSSSSSKDLEPTRKSIATKDKQSNL